MLRRFRLRLYEELIMGKKADAWITRLNTLDRELEKLEKKTFKAAQLSGLAIARKGMIRAMRSMGFGRYGHGLAIAAYRKLYRQRIEQAWRDDVDGAALKIAKAMGYKAPKSVSNLIDDALLADELGELLRNAMVDRGYDPAARKNRDIVKSLIDRGKPRTRSDAVKLVDEAIATHSAGKSGQGAANAAQYQEQLVNRIAKFIIKLPRRTWSEAFKEIFEQVRETLKAEQTRQADNQRRQESTPAATVVAGTLKRPGPVAVSRPAGSDVPNPGNPASVGEASPSPVQSPKHHHPWGDACLDTLQILKPGPEGKKLVKFDRELLYSVENNRHPTRYLVGGLLDLFDPGVTDACFDEHLNVFMQAKWHTFLALTPHIEVVRKHWKRWMKKNGSMGFPVNFWPGALIDRVYHLERMRIAQRTSMPWVSFVG